MTRDAAGAAIAPGGLTEVGAVQAATRAGTGCGSCVPPLRALLAGSGAPVSSRCASTSARAGGRLHPGQPGHGHILDGEQAALRDTNDHFLANIQRNGTYSVVPRIPGGEITRTS